MLTYQKGDEMGVARKRFWDSTGELSSWPRALGQITLSHYSPTSRTNHQEIGQCSQEGAWFMGISSNSHRWLIHQLLRKKVTSIVILPTQHSSKRPQKRYIKAKIQLKSFWIEPFPIILVEFLWSNHPTWHRCSTHGLFSAGHVRTDGTGGTGVGGDPKRVEGGGWLDVVRENYLGCHNMWDFINTLWLCQNSYWKWPFIVSFPINNGDFP